MSNWLHAVDGNFNNKHAWGPHMVPGKADDAILYASGAAFTVTSTSNQDVNSLQTSANATLYMQGSAKHAQTFTVEDGTAAGVNAGTIKVGDNVTLQLLGKNFKAETYFVNSGVISLNAKTDNSFLEVQTYDLSGGGTVQFSGGGSIVMSDSAFNGIVDTGVAAYESARVINIDNTISGAGVIGDGGLTNGVLLDFQNGAAGVINATGTNNALIVNAPTPGAFTSVYNEGLMEATGKAGLNIAASIVDNATGTIFAGNGSIVRLESATIEGGTFNTAGTGVVLVSGGSTIDGATFGAATNSGVLQDFGEAMYARGAITNSGSIRLSDQTTGAIMKVDVGVSLSGGGTVTLTDNFQNGIQGAGSADSALYNVDNTIAGAGTLGGGRLSLVNEAKGVIDARGPTIPCGSMVLPGHSTTMV